MPPLARSNTANTTRTTRASAKKPAPRVQIIVPVVEDSVIIISDDDDAPSAPKLTRKRTDSSRAGSAGQPPRKRKVTPVKSVPNAGSSGVLPVSLAVAAPGPGAGEGAEPPKNEDSAERAELARLQKVVATLTSGKVAASNEVQRLKDENTRLDSDNRALQSTNLTLTEDHQQLSAVYQDLHAASGAMSVQIRLLSTQLADAKQAVQRAQVAQHGADRQSAKQLAEQLDDLVSCEICVAKMWSPQILQCGHTFCAPCLTDWFTAALTQHLQQYPHWAPAPAPVLNAQSLRDGRLMHSVMMHASRVDPSYTCPTCRAVVRTRPAEVFTLKSVVAKVAELTGEVPDQRERAGNRAGMWDGFFPPT